MCLFARVVMTLIHFDNFVFKKFGNAFLTDTSSLSSPFNSHDGAPYHMETSPLICFPVICFPVNSRDRSSHLEVFCRKGVLRHFAKFLGKHLYQGHFLIKLQARACNFI